MSEDTLEIIESFYPTAYTLGDVGEVLTASVLRNSCDMQVIRNVYLPVDDHFMEIDMIALSPLGVFVVENKNYSGLVSGSYNDKAWKVLYGIEHIETLSNPIVQNLRHKNRVIDILKLYDFYNIPVFQPVIFNDKTQLNLKNCEKYVFSLSEFADTYNQVKSRGTISDETLSELSYLFKRYSNCSDEMKRLHKFLLNSENRRML